MEFSSKHFFAASWSTLFFDNLFSRVICGPRNAPPVRSSILPDAQFPHSHLSASCTTDPLSSRSSLSLSLSLCPTHSLHLLAIVRNSSKRKQKLGEWRRVVAETVGFSRVWRSWEGYLVVSSVGGAAVVFCCRFCLCYDLGVAGFGFFVCVCEVLRGWFARRVVSSSERASDLISEKKDSGVFWSCSMALEWAALGAVTAAEAIILILLTLPGTQGLRKGLIAVARTSLQPLLAVVPFALFLLLEIYWKYEHLPECKGPTCSVAEQDRHSKSVFKSQRNGILVLGALLLYWVLYRVTALLVSLERISNQLKNLKPSE